MGCFSLLLLIRMKLFLSLLFASSAVVAVVRSEDGHAHHICGCEAAEFGFTITCASTTAVSDALTYLNANCNSENCKDEHTDRRRSENECYKNYLILQSHHDHCLHDDLLQNEETEFHKFQKMCGEGCEIARKTDPALSACPTVNCTTAEGEAAVAVLEANSCNSSCTSTACGSAYKKIKYLHDVCETDPIDAVVGKPLHAYEDKCEDDGQGCNTAAGDADPNACPSSSTTAALASFTLVVASLLAM